MLYKIPLVLDPQSEGGFTVTSPILPELVTEGDTVEEVLANVQDALLAVIEAYRDLGRSLPASLQLPDTSGSVWLETLVATASFCKMPYTRLPVKSRQIIDTFFEQMGLFLGPVLHGLKGWNVA